MEFSILIEAWESLYTSIEINFNLYAIAKMQLKKGYTIHNYISLLTYSFIFKGLKLTLTIIIQYRDFP